MDPAGPWSAYASYNRLAAAGVPPGGTTPTVDLHHHLTATGVTPGAPAVTTAQILPGTFLPPTPVGYESVFPPLFHAAASAGGSKPSPAHYVAQHRGQGIKPEEGNFQQPQMYFDQNAGTWQQTSPFGILPHESVVPTTTTTKPTNSVYENFNAHLAVQSLNHLNSQLAANAKGMGVARGDNTQVTSTKGSLQNFFIQVPSVSYALSESSPTKNFTSCVASSGGTIPSKDYRIPQTQPRAFLPAQNPPRTLTGSPANQKQTSPQAVPPQPKTLTKNFVELQSQINNRKRTEDASPPINFPVGNENSRVAYSNNKRVQYQQTPYRTYSSAGQTPSPDDFQRIKPEFSNGSDCTPRRPSPLQAHSPVYPMYNNSSPQQTPQVTTPLDVTVARPNAVAYPSVITRALNPEQRYDRNQQQCWEDRQRKYPNSMGYPGQSGVEINFKPVAGEQRTLLEAERQPYYEAGHQVNLQDLSSCRGDPMTIVKNLQQQQSCQLQQNPEKELTKAPVKRRKSAEKKGNSQITGRIPPPAHTTGTTNVVPPQQNGINTNSYFDFDRWNLPNPTNKLFPSAGVHQQHQGLMVPHHHAPPPLPYFAPFHVGPHGPSGDYSSNSSAELTPLMNYGEQNANSMPYSAQDGMIPHPLHLQQQEDQPKVVVPNIEEELNFLQEDCITSNIIPQNNIKPSSASTTPIVKPPDTLKSPNAGFMSSYLKFLQGDIESSPPPVTRNSRKQSWLKTKSQANETKPPETNPDANITPIINQPALPLPPKPPLIPPPSVSIPTNRLISKGDPQDDPRYFPLPKERKRNSFDSSDDGFSSEDDFFAGQSKENDSSKLVKSEMKPIVKTHRKEKSQEQKRLKRAQMELNRQQNLLKSLAKPKKPKKPKESKVKLSKIEIIPRRETSKRAAKDKSIDKLRIEDDFDEPPEYQDSDSDPAWTPLSDDDDDLSLKKRIRNRQGGKSKKGMKSLFVTASNEAGIADIELEIAKAKGTVQNKQPLTLEDNIEASINHITSSNSTDDLNNFKIGEFVVLRSELEMEWPALWRIDGKTLLQKYESFGDNGIILYKNIATYGSWTSDSKKQYISVPVRYVSQKPFETIVELLKNELIIIDQKDKEEKMKLYDHYQDNFEVYIQTLISQALDSNFLMEIFQEKDEYFLSNVRTIDEITSKKKETLLSLLRWPPPVQAAVTTWPCFNVITEVNLNDANTKYCAACNRLGIMGRVLMYGQPYNSSTLEGTPPDPSTINEKDFPMCRICSTRVEISNKVTHQKYLMYIQCSKKVSDKRLLDPSKDTTCILNELLADEAWLSQLFVDVRSLWAEVDCLEKCLTAKKQC